VTGERVAYNSDGRVACEWNVAVHDGLSVVVVAVAVVVTLPCY